GIRSAGPPKPKLNGRDHDQSASNALLRERAATIAIVDDDPSVLRSVARLLSVHGFKAREFSSSEHLLAQIESLAPACVIADLAMPGRSGLDRQRALDDSGACYPIIFVTGHGDIRTSVLAMRSGAVDFLTKPFDQHDLLDAVERALARSRQSLEA